LQLAEQEPLPCELARLDALPADGARGDLEEPRDLSDRPTRVISQPEKQTGRVGKLADHLCQEGSLELGQRPLRGRLTLRPARAQPLDGGAVRLLASLSPSQVDRGARHTSHDPGLDGIRVAQLIQSDQGSKKPLGRGIFSIHRPAVAPRRGA
jgi:hypothetical protein